AARGRRLSARGSSRRRDRGLPRAGSALHPRRPALRTTASRFESSAPTGGGADRSRARVVLRPLAHLLATLGGSQRRLAAPRAGSGVGRSEERRVGKEGGGRGSRGR